MLLFSSYQWIRMTLVAHPDMLLSLIVLFSCWRTFKYFESRTNKNFYIMAIFWGISMDLKISAVYFYLSVMIGLMFSIGLRRVNWNKIKVTLFKFVFISFGTYTLIGFPQNLLYHKRINAFGSVARFSATPDWASVTDWLGLIISQCVCLLITIFIFKILFKTNHLSIDKKPYKLFSIVCLFSLFFLLSSKTRILKY